MTEQIKYGDALYHCLALLVRIFDAPKHVPELLAGLPVDGRHISLKTFARAIQRIGLHAQVRKVPLKKISRLSMPLIIFLSDEEVVYVQEYLPTEKQYRVLSADGEAREFMLDQHELAKRYLGYVVQITPVEEPLADMPAPADNNNRWLWKAIFKSWRLYRDVLLASFLINVFALTSPLFIMNVYDRVVPNEAIETLWVLVSGVLIVFAFDLVLRLLRGYFVDIAGQRTDVEVSAFLYQHVLGIRMAKRPASVGAFANHLDEFDSVRNFITSATITTLIDLPFVILFLFVIWFVGGSLVVVPLLAIPLILIYALLVQPMIRTAIQRVTQATAIKNATLVESLVGIESIKLLGAESRQQHKWEQAIEHIARWSVRSRILSASVVNTAVFLQQLTTVGVVTYGVYLIAQGNLSLGGLIAAVILTSRALAPMAQLANLGAHYHRVVSALRAIRSILALPVERNPDNHYLLTKKIKGEVDFENVSFSYPDQPIEALHSVNLKIMPGEHVAIIGRTGSGKSTLGKLIAGLYQENTGFVRIDGLDVRQLDPIQLRRSIGYVPQDVMLFNTSMRENILFGAESVSDDQLIAAAERSGTMNIIKKHPAGFDMPIGERGQGLSGGQRQSVAIARAILHDPPIIIMDEPSNSMDNVTEERLKISLTPYLQDKTFILISHKPSMLELVDRLIVIEEGRIIANGNKAEVIEALHSTQKARQS